MRPCDGSAHAFMDGTIWIIGHGGDAQHPIQPGEAHRVSGRPQPQPSVGGPQIGTDITLAHCQHRVPHIGGAPQQKLGPFGNVRERPLPYRTHPPFLVLVQRQNAAVVRHVDVETDLDRAERIIRVLLLEPYSTMRGLEDMSVAGHDGSDVAASIKLTTMAQPASEIGRIAARKNIGSRRKKTLDEPRTIIQTVLTPGDTTRPIAHE